jgi:hypothetical protein
MDPTRPLVADVWAGASPSDGRGVPHWSHTRFMSPKSLAPRQRRRKMRGANPELEGRLNMQRQIVLRHFFRCRIRLRIRRFLRPTLRRPLPRRRLAMRSPLGIGEATRHDCETNRTNFRPGKNTNSIPNDLIVSRSTSQRFSGDWRSSRGSQPSRSQLSCTDRLITSTRRYSISLSSSVTAANFRRDKSSTSSTATCG